MLDNDHNLYEHWCSIVPREKFDTLSLIRMFDTFQMRVESELKKGTLDVYLQTLTNSTNWQEQVYIVSAPTELLGSTTDYIIHQNYNPANLYQVRQNIIEFINHLETLEMPEIIKQQYQTAANEYMNLINLVGHVGRPEFTKYQVDSHNWKTILDVQKSSEMQTAILEYETIAQQILAQTEPQISGHTVKQNLERWQLTPREKEYIHWSHIDDQQMYLSPIQTKHLMEILLRRLGLVPNWKVIIESNVAALMVNAKQKSIIIPDNRELHASEVLYIPGHEMIHVVRSHNGYKQVCRVVSEGMKDYIQTEEGLATTSEIALGETFDHPRRRLIAARYLAVAMALKVTDNQPQYTWQQIYDTLTQYKIDASEASQIILRLMRGTSFQRQVITITFPYQQQIIQLPIAECFTKDAAYFTGSIKIMEWLNQQLAPQQPNHIRTVQEFQASYIYVMELPPQKLHTYIQQLTVSKMTLESITEDMRWKPLLDYNDITQWHKIIEPQA